MEVLDYIWGRWRTLYPVLDYDHSQDKPIRLFASLDRRQWGYFLASSCRLCSDMVETNTEFVDWLARLDMGCVRLSHGNDHLH